MNLIALCLTVVFLLCPFSPPVSASMNVLVNIEPRSLKQGEVALVEVRGVPRTMRPQAVFSGTAMGLVYDPSSSSFKGLLGIDLACRPGVYALELRAGEHTHQVVPIYVDEMIYGVRKISLPPSMTEYDEKTLERIEREKERVDALWAKSIPNKLWKGSFIRPVDGEVTGGFGTRTLINGEERSPHSGVDLHAEMHENIRCSNSGRVVLSDDLFFTGKSIIIDHGSGLFTMYFHLSEVFPREGDMVEKGRVIGRAGSTGRSTGPHLHWGVRLEGARVNPLDLVRSSERYAQPRLSRGKGRKNGD